MDDARATVRITDAADAQRTHQRTRYVHDYAHIGRSGRTLRRCAWEHRTR
jgi:hypothetical protein